MSSAQGDWRDLVVGKRLVVRRIEHWRERTCGANTGAENGFMRSHCRIRSVGYTKSRVAAATVASPGAANSVRRVSF